MTPLIKQRDLMESLIKTMEGSKNIKVRCPSTVKSYCKSLRTVANKTNAYMKENDETVFDYAKLSDTKLVLESIKSVKKSTQKSYLEGLVAVLTFQDEKLYKSAIDIYRKQKEVDRQVGVGEGHDRRTGESDREREIAIKLTVTAGFG